ncbi:MaoC/PaaZ C-terminal domain-containing protein [Sinobaca sp. H24]|uniref:MaoC/PaaZ C-terminal domain-containing protein n=1 Tax=Sinobaca sp. H24 TaxID=2923376 RepID=UPI002079CD17|nr:MaoC/PaaZ C-terminal domain-containing protein [Sinobaca sp. H24]
MNSTSIDEHCMKVPGFTKKQVQAYARASGDLNGIHIDEEQARANGLPGVIVHGLLTMACTSIPFIPLLENGWHVSYFQTRFTGKVFLEEALFIEWMPAETEEEKLFTLKVSKEDGTKVTEGIIELSRSKSM